VHHRRRTGLLFIGLLILALPRAGLTQSQPNVLRVGVYDNPPRIFRDEQGRARGFFPEVTEALATELGYRLRHVPCEWERCLTMLESGEIDLMPDVARTPDRLDRFRFSHEAVMHSWSYVYQPAAAPRLIEDIADLQGLRVAVIAGGVQEGELRRMNSSGSGPVVVPATRMESVLAMVESGVVDAGIVNKFFGEANDRRYKTQRAPLIFQPISIYYAFAPEAPDTLVAGFDSALARMKSAPDSPYYRASERWDPETPADLPDWLLWALLGSLGLLLAGGIHIALLRRHVVDKTRQLSESRTRLRTILDSMPSALSLKDKGGRYRVVNRAFCEARGRSQPEILGRTAKDIMDSSLAERIEAIEAELGPETPVVTRMVEDPSTPHRRVLNITKFLVTGHDGTVTGVGSFIDDVTAQVEAEEDRATAMVELERANQAKSEFLATMSHELRTPLNAILGFSEMLRAQYFGPLGAENYKEYAEDIHRSGAHLLTLINDLLEISTIEAGRRKMKIEPVDLSEVIADAVSQVTPEAQDNDLRIVTELPQGSPRVAVDERALRQILINLLSNAVRFTQPGGSVTVSARSSDEAFSVEVRDTGVGIPEDEVARVVEPFAQVGTVAYCAGPGTGLGLSIVKSFVDAHGGHLDISSKLGEGTAVTVTIPQAASGERTVAAG